MKKSVLICAMVVALLASNLLPIALAIDIDPFAGKTEINAVAESNNGLQGLEYAELATGDSQTEAAVTVVQKPTVTLKSPALEFKDMICIIAFYTVDNMQDVAELGMITYDEKVSVVDVNTADYVIPGASYDAGTGRYYSSSQGIHAKYLADTVYLACYAKLTDGSYVYSKLAPYSAVTYATNQLKNSTDMKLKQLVAAMLNYGAAAQLYFDHNVGTLSNSTISDEQKALPEVYGADMVSAVPSVPAEKQGVFSNNKGFATRRPAVSFEGAFSINYFFVPKYVPDNGITMYYWNAKDYDSNSVLTVSNASGSMKLEGSGTGEYRGDITGIAAKALSEAVYVAVTYENGGTLWTSGVLGYSIGAYCASQSTKGGTIAELAMATAVYGYHAKLYFGVQSTEPMVTVGNATGATGSQVEVAVDVSNCPELYAMYLTLTYDDAALTLISATSEKTMQEFVYTNPSQLRSGSNFMWYDNDPNAVSGTVLKLTFTIAPTAVPGIYPITITCDSGNTYDANDNDVEMISINGRITVTG